jgi:hypothetical protein
MFLKLPILISEIEYRYHHTKSRKKDKDGVKGKVRVELRNEINC